MSQFLKLTEYEVSITQERILTFHETKKILEMCSKTAFLEVFFAWITFKPQLYGF